MNEIEVPKAALWRRIFETAIVAAIIAAGTAVGVLVIDQLIGRTG